MSRQAEECAPVVAVPADLEIEDRVVGPFTARQALILGGAAAGVYVAGSVLRPMVPLPVLFVAGLVLVGILTVAVTARRNGLSLDRLAGLAAAFAMRPKKSVADASDTHSRAELTRLVPTSCAFAEPGLLDLGEAGAVALVECDTVNLSLFSGSEARAVLIALGAVLNSIGGSFQVAALTHRIELDAHAERLDLEAAELPGIELQKAAVDHARFLRHLGEGGELFARRVLLALHEPGTVLSGGPILAARAAQTVQLLGACGLSARQLTSAEAAAAVAAACDPQRGPAAMLLNLSDPQSEVE